MFDVIHDTLKNMLLRIGKQTIKSALHISTYKGKKIYKHNMHDTKHVANVIQDMFSSFACDKISQSYLCCKF